jgi:cysteine desulfurase
MKSSFGTYNGHWTQRKGGERMVSGISQEIYLDNNATTQPLPQVQEAMLDVLGVRFGNSSSAHAAGDRALEHLHKAREAVAALVGAEPAAIVFTSGATETNNIVLASVLQKRRCPPRVVITQVEHSSVLKYCDYLSDLGVEVIYLPVDRSGHLSSTDLETAITPETTLVSVQWVNNETGVILPIEWIGTLCRRRGVPFHQWWS